MSVEVMVCSASPRMSQSYHGNSTPCPREWPAVLLGETRWEAYGSRRRLRHGRARWAKMSSETLSGIEQLLDTPDLAGALDSDQFKLFLDQVPVAIAVSELSPHERVVYANREF